MQTPLLPASGGDDPTAGGVPQPSDLPAPGASTARADQQGEPSWRRFLKWRSAERKAREETARAQRNAENQGWRTQNFAVTCNFLKNLWPPCRNWALSDLGLADFLESFANLAAMMILSLNIYCATFFMAWAKDDSVCIGGAFPNSVKIWMKVIAVCLPFTVCPVTLYVAGQAKALQRNTNALGFVSCLVMLEVIYIFALGGVMTVCMASRRWQSVLVVTGIISVLLITVWGCCCKSPRCLRCCCPEENVVNQDVENGAGA